MLSLLEYILLLLDQVFLIHNTLGLELHYLVLRIWVPDKENIENRSNWIPNYLYYFTNTSCGQRVLFNLLCKQPTQLSESVWLEHVLLGSYYSYWSYYTYILFDFLFDWTNYKYWTITKIPSYWFFL